MVKAAFAFVPCQVSINSLFLAHKSLENYVNTYRIILLLAARSEKVNIDFVCETVNFGSLNLTILKKKSKNTTKYHNIFTISLFLGSK